MSRPTECVKCACPISTEDQGCPKCGWSWADPAEAVAPAVGQAADGTRSVWGPRLARSYYAGMLALAAVFGLIGGLMDNSDISTDPIAVLSFFILFPAYVLADGIVNARFVRCPLRAGSLPLAEGYVISKVADWPDPFAVSQIVAIIYVLASLVVITFARVTAARRR